jgi:hypothetical protein
MLALAVAHFSNGTPMWAIAVPPAFVVAVVASSWLAARASNGDDER